MEKIRFIDSGARNAVENMATDEALAASIARQRNFAYLRFYQWNPATLSFGYNQQIEKLVDIDAARAMGFEIVRRMSGGKMVFHNLELTFSLGLTAETIVSHTGKSATFLDMFKFAIEPIVEALSLCHVPARFSSAREMRHTSANNIHCYAAAAGHSIFADDRKLVGAAGIFRQNCLIIHGSIPLKATFPPGELFTGKSRPDAGVTMAALYDYLSVTEANGIPMACAMAYAGKLGFELNHSSLSQEEQVMADNLAATKYSNLFWKNNTELETS